MQEHSMLYSTHASALVVILFCFLLIFTAIGVRVGRKRKSFAPVNEQSVPVASLLALQGLLLAFTFAMAGTRFEARRTAIVDEAKAINTVIQRVDLYEPTQRQAFRRDLNHYLEARLQYSTAPFDKAVTDTALRRSARYGRRLWARTMLLAPNLNNQIATEQMVTGLNTMFEQAIARQAARRARVPDPIVYMLFIMSLATAFFTGYTSANRHKVDWLAVGAFHFLVAMVIYITLDLDRPRRGLIRVSDMNELMLDLRQVFRAGG
ncbi:bestrophin-like domain [Hymenobacter daecheongensis]|nr:hypothetical protein [Hymenobacter daecheongensis]